MWKNFRNSNLHRAVKLKPSDLFAEVILIDEANVSTFNVSTFSQPESAKALTTSFNSGGKGKQNKRKRESFHHGEVCKDCQIPGHVVENCLKKCRFCFERDHVIEDCFKRRWVDEQWFSKRSTESSANNINSTRKDYSPSFESPFKHSIEESYPSSKNNFK